MNSTPARFAFPALIALLMSASPAAALEQNCRFIQANADREACYKRQEEQLAARRKPAPAATSESATMESPRQMRQDDDAVYRSIHGICRGC
jgi:hypothetical protein